jgi:methylisocitrate lyase
MTAAAALQENLKVLAKSRSTKALPRPVMAHDPFVEFIGFPQIDELQRKFLRTPQAAE